MRKLVLAAAGATALAIIPGAQAAPQVHRGTSFADASILFSIADRNNDNSISRSEYRMLREQSVSAKSVRLYGTDTSAERNAVIDGNFRQVDTDRSGAISRLEFMRAANQPRADLQAKSKWYWRPDYLGLGYYMKSTPVDTDAIAGNPVVNLDGDRIGRIDGIIRTDKTDRYYALIDLSGGPMLRFAWRGQDQVGVPLDDILLRRDGSSVMLSTRGENDLRHADAREIGSYHHVDTLYRAPTAS